ncbi:MAG: DUF885 family protein [Alphaproteobacteria bacterium]|nr:MAG: DUF885 family protein [Alphaproteobacteria bacterium]
MRGRLMDRVGLVIKEGGMRQHHISSRRQTDAPGGWIFAFLLVLILMAFTASAGSASFAGDAAIGGMGGKRVGAGEGPGNTNSSARVEAHHALQTLFAEEWEARLQRNPFLAGYEGDHRFDDRLPDPSPAAQARALKADRDWLARLDAIIGLAGGALDEDDRLNAELFRFMLENRIRDARFRPWRIPFLSDSGFETEPVFAIEAMPFEDEADYRRYLRRLKRLPGYLHAHIANMRRGMAEGFTMPRAILDKALIPFARLAAPTRAEDSPFFRPFANLPKTIPPARAKLLKARARKVIGNRVLPAYRVLLTFMRDEYLPAARQTIGASDLPDGPAYYRAQIAKYTTLNLSPEEIHAIGWREVKRIRAEMRKVIAETGFKGDFAAFLAFLRSDPRFYAKTPEKLLEHAAWITKQVDGILPAFFGRLPRMPYGVRAVPAEIAPNYTTGRYWPAIPGVRGGLFMVNTYALDKRPLYALPALALHEAAPGHHLQISLAREQADVPAFRRNLYVVAFGEGWGLYAEKLGEEMGIYRTPYERFGRLTYEMWRAGRLVVDTGIHAMGWTRERAVRFFRENTALSEHNIETEVDRYISWPGQALGYKLGELKILELRHRAERALGRRFDIRAFHDAVLEKGALPLPILERRIDAWIAEAQHRVERRRAEAACASSGAGKRAATRP